jgi:hypothetical protein
MNEKTHFRFVIMLVVVAVLLGVTIGLSIGDFFFGRGNYDGPAGPADADQRIERTLEELGRESEQERAIAGGLTANSGRAGAVISGIAESTRQARADTEAVVSIGGGAADSLQKIIAKVEILNRYLGDIERQLDGYRDLAGGE